MFTGLIEEIGSIQYIESVPGGKKLKIKAKAIIDDIKIDDSVAVNGVCLTVTKIDPDGVWMDAVGATLEKTTLRTINLGIRVNLERALTLTDRLGGHMVLGHVNGIGKIIALNRSGEYYNLQVSFPSELKKYIVKEGSVAIDGISLTVANLSTAEMGISVIPHTWARTTLSDKRIGDFVNIETDVLAKYIESLIFDSKNQSSGKKISEEWLKNLGF